MAINFPSNPLDGTTFVANGVTYAYESNNDRWRARSSFSAASGGAEDTGTIDTVFEAGIASTATFLDTLDGGSS
jgi:hypothetical protein